MFGFSFTTPFSFLENTNFWLQMLFFCAIKHKRIWTFPNVSCGVASLDPAWRLNDGLFVYSNYTNISEWCLNAICSTFKLCVQVTYKQVKIFFKFL